jgi:hypothetical protein
MARIRSIKPEFFANEDLARCSPMARLLAIAVLQLADGKGRFRWIGIQVQAHAFPFDEDVEIEALAAELEAIGYLRRYRVNGRTYADIPTFERHQRLQSKEIAQGSNLPAYPEQDEEIPGTHPGAFPERTEVRPRNATEEEREEEGKRKGKDSARSRGPTDPPDEIPITDAMREWFAEKRFPGTPEQHAEAMLDWHRARGRRAKDWQACWRTWCRKAQEFAPQHRARDAPDGPTVSRKFIEANARPGETYDDAYRRLTAEARRA